MLPLQIRLQICESQDPGLLTLSIVAMRVTARFPNGSGCRVVGSGDRVLGLRFRVLAFLVNSSAEHGAVRPCPYLCTYTCARAHRCVGPGSWATELKKETPDPLANFEESVYQVFIHLYAQRWVA